MAGLRAAWLGPHLVVCLAETMADRKVVKKVGLKVDVLDGLLVGEKDDVSVEWTVDL